MTQTTADLLFAQGIEQGERKGTIESILALLGTQFPPSAVQALKPTLQTIDLPRLKQLLIAAPQVQSLEAFIQIIRQ